jgi:uncharacterized membrane protein
VTLELQNCLHELSCGWIMMFSFSNYVLMFPCVFLSGQCYFSVLAHTVIVCDAAQHTAICKWFIFAREECLLNSA